MNLDRHIDLFSNNQLSPLQKLVFPDLFGSVKLTPHRLVEWAGVEAVNRTLVPTDRLK